MLSYFFLFIDVIVRYDGRFFFKIFFFGFYFVIRCIFWEIFIVVVCVSIFRENFVIIILDIKEIVFFFIKRKFIEFSWCVLRIFF